MPSSYPRDISMTLLPPDQAGVTLRQTAAIGTFTANTTVSRGAIIFDRAAVIREIWIMTDAVASDPDGTMVVTVSIRDISEGGFDVIVNSHDLESLNTVAFNAVRATLVAESSENELTVAAGDTVVVNLVNNSAAITTNPNVFVLIVYQSIAPIGI